MSPSHHIVRPVSPKKDLTDKMHFLNFIFQLPGQGCQEERTPRGRYCKEHGGIHAQQILIIDT